MIKTAIREPEILERGANQFRALMEVLASLDWASSGNRNAELRKVLEESQQKLADILNKIPKEPACSR